MNEEKFISTCLDSVIENDYDHEKMEIIIIDGLSKDRTRKIILDYQIKDCQYLNKMGMEIYIWKHLLKLRLIYQINKKNY